MWLYMLICNFENFVFVIVNVLIDVWIIVYFLIFELYDGVLIIMVDFCCMLVVV